jgi:hypothetical protein
MKNEVKKKMNIVRRAALYQSHTENDSQEENFDFAVPKVVVRGIASCKVRPTIGFASLHCRLEDNPTLTHPGRGT